MSATEWKFVPVESDENMATAFFDRVTVTSRGGLIGVRSALNAAIAAAPVPPSVESLLENWTPSDQKAFAKFRDEHFPGEMDSYAIQSLGSAWKDGQANASPEVPQYTGTGSDSLDCILGVGGFASFGPLDAQPVAHLTIPGALEWDGDNGTHGVVGTHSADSESKAVPSGNYVQPVPEHCDRITWRGSYYHLPIAPVSAYTAVDMSTAAAGGFRDGLKAFSEDGNRNVLAEVFFQQGDEPFICAVRGRICVEQLEAAQRDFRENLPEQFEQGDGIYTFDFFYEKGQYDEWGRCEIAPGWGFDFVSYAAFEADDEPKVEPEAFDDIPDFTPGNGNKAKRRIVAMEAAKQKTCIECDQPYCHGVCVERGDQDYDRDQAAKGGDQ